MQQTVIHGFGSHQKTAQILERFRCKKYLLVCDTSFPFLGIGNYFSTLSTPYAVFDSFTPNPDYEAVCNGVSLFHREKCDCIIAVGGGSSIDVAKCIKLFAGMEATDNYLNQTYTASKIPLIAIPTTAGTGSESTCFAVIYNQGKKLSIAHESILPDCAILEPSFLRSLPVYQKKCTLLDALCQAIESWWSVRSNGESISYSKQAIELILRYQEAYLKQSSDEATEQILLAANLAGRAINLTTTTAAHAMSYKLTTLYGLPHGHAVAVCLPKLWKFMSTHMEQCNDPRGKEHLDQIFEQIAVAMGRVCVADAIELFERLLTDMAIEAPRLEEKVLPELIVSVNPARLGNNPVKLSEEDLTALYRNISK